MRKLHKKLILDIAVNLNEAGAEIQGAFFNKDTQKLAVLIADCQEIIVQISDFITRLDGENVKTIGVLKESSNILNEISNRPDDCYDLIKQFKKHNAVITNSIKNDIEENRIEVAFFPYKASMWDTFESIWRAAEADPQCDVYVVPVPYYDKLSDGSFGKMNYERDLYPDYVQVTDRQQYDVETRRPDVIFIHNPYDNGNYVTSVHPDFYAERLKKYTDLLVYIPYFVASLDTISENFCVVPGTLHAHKVIVQSEGVRQDYIQHIKQFEKNTNAGKFDKPESKILALGSPKFDAVMNKKRNDFKLPEEWIELIGNKKIILYNTGVGTILKHDEQYLEKLRTVVEAFRKRDDVVVWWRPHPLSLSTYESLRPQLATEYKRIVAMYKEAGFGIYDDSADLNRAIAWSDAYYGDLSSLVAMYKVTGKPILLQNIHYIHESSESMLQFESFYDDGQYYWFSAFHYNALFKMDKQTRAAEYVGSFPNEKIYAERLYSSVDECNGKLYFAPLSANEIAEYDLNTGVFKKIPLAPPVKKVRHLYDSEKLLKVAVIGNHVFFIPRFYPGIVCYNTITQSLSYHHDWVDKTEKKRTKDNVSYFADYEINDRKLIIPCACADVIIIFDIDTMTSDVWDTSESVPKHKYYGVCCDGGNYYFTYADGSIIKRKMESKDETVTNLKQADSGYDEKNNVLFYYPVRYYDGYIFMFPHKKGNALKINVETGETTINDVFDDECGYDGDLKPFLGVEINNDRIYAMTGKSSRFIEYDPKTNEKNEQQPTISNTCSVSIKKLLENDILIENVTEKTYESAVFPLEDMLNSLSRTAGTQDNSANDSLGTAGDNIYAFVKKEAGLKII
ncbi:MAG: CDP-glycerol glycerophosphotransferase family protein [Oscillospiraceae bacterium]|nr:CDP-glycerol glycerophosphotransferase family protein [Oscillospiraceae bacterium]